jgi:hypothetical protein
MLTNTLVSGSVGGETDHFRQRSRTIHRDALVTDPAGQVDFNGSVVQSPDHLLLDTHSALQYPPYFAYKELPLSGFKTPS